MKKYIALIVLLVWAFFPPTLFHTKADIVYKKNSDDGNYSVVIYSMKPISLYSIYKISSGEKYYFALYDKCGNEIFKPSPYYGTWDMGAADGIQFITSESKFQLVYAGSDSLDGAGSGIFEINSKVKLTCH